jgi:hypothetical protein
MNFSRLISEGYDQLKQSRADLAVSTCLRLARHTKDYLNVAVFLREIHDNGKDFLRSFFGDVEYLTDDAKKYLADRSLAYWLETHTLPFEMGVDEDGNPKKVLTTLVAEIDPELDQWEKTIADMTVPQGMGEYDTAAFFDENARKKAAIRQRMRALQTIKQKVAARCLDYLSQLERQLTAQNQTQGFLDQVQNEVNNFFKARSEADVYRKLLAATSLANAANTESCAMLLTEVRRTLKSAADHFYPRKTGMTVCSDGKQRALGDDKYLSRLYEHIHNCFGKSSAGELLDSELQYLAGFLDRLNGLACKGVHSEVTQLEARQGLIGLYMFLYKFVGHAQAAAR